MSTQSNRARVVMERVIATAALTIAFIVMGSIIVPGQSTAHDRHAEDGSGEHANGGHGATSSAGTEPSRSGAHSTDVHDGLVNLGSVEGKAYHIDIYSTDAGVRYTLIDADTDDVLGELLSVDQIRRFYPEAPIDDIDFSVPSNGNGPVMYVDDDAGFASGGR